MKKIKLYNLKLIYRKLAVKIKKTPWIMGEWPFLTLSSLIIIVLILSGFIFYRYAFLADKKVLEL